MDDILYHDRYLDKVCVEKVYGDRSLRWTYQTLGGKIALAALVKRAWFSRWYGAKMDHPKTRQKIAPFVDEFDLDADDFELPLDQFTNFNDFFARKLKPTARPIDPDPNAIVFPADGRHLCIPDLSRCDGLFVKGEMFALNSLLQDDALTARFAGGSLLLSRLCPVDYHRFHFPISGQPGDTRIINGPLYSVNPIALRQNIRILATNKRTVTVLQNDRVGDVLLLEIGATCVGSIRQTFAPRTAVTKGDEKGYFRFGGSSTITIFPAGCMCFDEDLRNQSANHRELYARMGDHMGTMLH